MDFSVIAEAGLTQSEFASLAGVSRVTVNTWVMGKMAPHRYTTNKIAALLTHLRSAITAGALPPDAAAGKSWRLGHIKDAIRAAIVKARSNA